MELGEKIRQARLAAGLSQRQLCGEEITRNMLSLIENGAAQPSMKTLGYLAQQLGKPLSWFLDDAAGEIDREREQLDLLRRAETALTSGREILASQLLEQITEASPMVQRQKFLLMARLPGMDPAVLCAALPSLDEELLLRAEAALQSGQPDRCLTLLQAAEKQESRWHWIAGRMELSRKAYSTAAEYLHQAEESYPEVNALLEICYRELGDFKRAYEYACRQKR